MTSSIFVTTKFNVSLLQQIQRFTSQTTSSPPTTPTLRGGREGYGVFRLTRRIESRYRFVRWGLRAEEEDAKGFRLVLSQKLLGEMPVRGGRAFAPVRHWCQALGIVPVWNGEGQTFTFNGKEVALSVTLIDGVAHAPIRELVASAGLRLAVDGGTRTVYVSR